MLTVMQGRRLGHRPAATVVVALVATMALVGAACTAPPPPADPDVVLLASQQPGGIANYQNVVVPNVGTFSAGTYIEVGSAQSVDAVVSRPFYSVDRWSILCSGPSTDNGDGSFSCPADLEYSHAVAAAEHHYEGQGLLTTWPDTDPKFAAYVGNATTYTYSFRPGDLVYHEPDRVGQMWAEELRFQDGDDTVSWPPR